jgi:hypothetical protein
VVSGPLGSFLASIPARRTQPRTAVSVRSSSLAICPTLLPLERTRPTTSALNSGAKLRLFRFSMDLTFPQKTGRKLTLELRLAESL